MATRWPILVRVPMEEPAHQSERENFKIEPVRPMPDVKEVVLDPLFNRRVAAPTIHLRPARHAGLHAVTEHVLRDLFAELLDEDRPLGARAHETHFALEHVP